MSSSTALHLSDARFDLEILPLGASLHGFTVTLPDGGSRNIVVGRPDPAVSSYEGATVGRFANRIDGAHFLLDGVGYALAPNEGRNQLHGGPGGFSTVVWDVEEVTPQAVTLTHVSPDGDQGYPGTLTVRATFSLVEDGAQVEYTATTDAPTVVNLTAHPYFNLGGATIESHLLRMPASAYTPTRPDLIPTGEIRDVEGTAADFRQGRVLGEAIAAAVASGIERAGGFDHNFVIDGEGMREHVRLTGPDGLTLVVRSDAPAVQIYTAEHLGRVGVAVEPQNYPDAPNHPEFPSAVLLPGDTYRTTTRWSVLSAR